MSANGGLYCKLDDILPLDLRLTAGLAGTSFACTDPEAGAGSFLTRSVLDMADADGLPAYLESTENAVLLYEKFGFAVIDRFEMEIPRRCGNKRSR